MGTRTPEGELNRRRRSIARIQASRAAADWLEHEHPDRFNAIVANHKNLTTYHKRDQVVTAAAKIVAQDFTDVWVRFITDATKDIPALPLGRPRGARG